MHEFLHLLYFNEYYLDDFKNKIIATPEVLKVGKKHFGCDSFRGIELERNRQGVYQSMHEETIHYGNDLMVPGVIGKSAVISRLILAALKDTKEYRVDYSKAGMLKFGYKQGCNFLEKTECDSEKYPQYFCEENQSFLCSPNFRNFNQC